MSEVEVTEADLRRARVVLAELQGDQERLGAQLAATGLTAFVDRAEWLMDHRSADRQLAWRRHWAELGVEDPEPRESRFDLLPDPTAAVVIGSESRFVRGSLAGGSRRRSHRRKPAPAIAPDRQMEIALAALAAQEAASAARKEAA